MFTAGDITATAPFPRSTVQRFNVEHDGSPLGWVTVRTADLFERRDDPAAHIADRLNEYERDRGFEELAAALADGLELT
ncbi:MAG: hypothetical protein M3417_01020 [Actinomycetota bacterium]|nr:hypothetical protein [Actinomycetota bacterium]